MRTQYIIKIWVFRTAIMAMAICGIMACDKSPADKQPLVYYYAQVNTRASNIVGVSANILTRYGKVFGEDTSEEETHTYAYCAVAKSSGELAYWAQVGYSTDRKPTNLLVSHSYTCEIMGADWQYWFSFDYFHDWPAEGTWNTYQCEVNLDSGIWTFSYNGSAIQTGFYPDSMWHDPGTALAWAGEIHNVANDMPGTEQFPCRFTELSYKKRGENGFEAVHCSASDVLFSSDPEHWPVVWDTMNGILYEVRIWDRYPLP